MSKITYHLRATVFMIRQQRIDRLSQTGSLTKVQDMLNTISRDPGLELVEFYAKKLTPRSIKSRDLNKGLKLGTGEN